MRFSDKNAPLILTQHGGHKPTSFLRPLTLSRSRSNIYITKTIPKLSEQLKTGCMALRTAYKVVVNIRNDEKREDLINKLRSERIKFLSSPTAELMRDLNRYYKKDSTNTYLDDLTVLDMILSDEIDNGREGYI